jgi:hypothetical protein
MRQYLLLAGVALLVFVVGVFLGRLSLAPGDGVRPDVTADATLSDTTQMHSLPVYGFQGASCVLSGDWKANVDFFVSCDGAQTWQRAMVYWEQQDGRVVDSVGAGQNGTYRWVDLGGVSHVGVRLGTYDSGSVHVLLRTTAAQANGSMAVARDGVMGPQTPIMHVVGGPDAGGQVVHAVRVTDSPVGASAYGLNVRPVPYSYRHISGNATTTVKTGPGILHALTINSAGSDWAITVYDGPAGTGTVLATITPVTGSTLTYDVAFATGCTVVTSGTKAGDVTVSYH